MAVYDIPGFSWTLPADADFSGATTVKNRAVSVNSDGEAILPANNYLKIIGVGRNKPVAGEGTTIVSSGIVVMDAVGVNDAGSPANAAIAPGDYVTARASDGKAVKCVTKGSQILGIVVKGSVSSAGTGEISVKLTENFTVDTIA